MATLEAVERIQELTDKSAAIAQFEALVASPEAGEQALKAKEQAIFLLGDLYAEAKQAEKLAALATSLRPFFGLVPKAKTAKIVRNLIDQVAKIPDSRALQMSLCLESIEWCKSEKRSFLRQRIQARLAALLLESKQYTDALALLGELVREVKRLDDKPLLVEIHLVEAQTYHAIRNLPKAKAGLTSARTSANAIYCPPLLQAQIDVMSGTLHADEKDYKTAFSYFYEALENFDSIGNPKGADCLKYMLLVKIMLHAIDDVNSIINGKPGMKHPGKGLEAMKAVAMAYEKRSLHDFEEALKTHKAELGDDAMIARHLANLYDDLLQENICKIIEPYSKVETSHIATVMKLPLGQIEEKLSQMILDKKFHGILDAGAGCLIVYDSEAADTTYDQALETLGNMGRVVDALYLKANKLASTGVEEVKEKKEGKEDKVLIKKKEKA